MKVSRSRGFFRRARGRIPAPAGLFATVDKRFHVARRSRSWPRIGRGPFIREREPNRPAETRETDTLGGAADVRGGRGPFMTESGPNRPTETAVCWDGRNATEWGAKCEDATTVVRGQLTEPVARG